MLSRFIILIFGNLYPAYKSYKSLRQRNQKEMLTLLMYWIVFAIFTAFESIMDIILCWFPFYYLLKTLFFLWMFLPITRGYSFIFRRIIHPELLKRETEIDNIIEKFIEEAYNIILNLGSTGFKFAASTVFTTALKGQQLLASRNLSLSDTSMDRRLPPLMISSDENMIEDSDSDKRTSYRKLRSGTRLKPVEYPTTSLSVVRRRHDIDIVPEEDVESDSEIFEKKSFTQYSRPLR